MTVSFWLDDEVESDCQGKTQQFDIAIIGGGLIGAACAYLLSHREGLRVALIESSTLGSQASGRNAGMVLRGIQVYYNDCVKRYGRDVARNVYRFAQENQEMIKEFARVHSVDLDLEPVGSYILAASIEELEELDESAQLLKEDGFEVEYLREDPLERDYYGALYNQHDFGINPVKLVRALVSLSEVTVFEGEHVRRIEGARNGGRMRIVCSRQEFVCEKVLLATNAYSNLIDPWFIERIRPYRGQIVVTEPLEKKLVSSLCYANYGWVYFRQLSCGRFLLGGRRQLFLEDESGFADMITHSVQTALESYLKEFFPEIAGVGIDYRFSGTMGFTKDGLPLVGAHPNIPGLYFAVAMNGHGLGYGLKMADHLISVALNEEDSNIFDPKRATLNEPVLSSEGP